jgi:hypothetical protein
VVEQVHRRSDLSMAAFVGVVGRSSVLPTWVWCGPSEAAALAGPADVAAKGLWHGTTFLPDGIPARTTTMGGDSTKRIVRVGIGVRQYRFGPFHSGKAGLS